MIYLDNNATTIMPANVIKEMTKWCNVGNPSASYQSAARSRKMMENFRQYIAKMCEFTVCCPDARDGARRPAEYKIIFTSGASEANSTILHAILHPYMLKGLRAHVIVSTIEHKSILDMVHKYEELGAFEVSWVSPVASGHILPQDVLAVVRKDSALITVMHANNETGAINDIAAIGTIARRHGIPFHSDTVQTFGKCAIHPSQMKLDSFCMSFHKVHGPPGVGALVVRQAFITECALTPLIFGAQNEGLRGGTENVPGLAAAFAGLYSMRPNPALNTLKKLMLTKLAETYPVKSYTEYIGAPAKQGMEIVVLSGLGDHYLANTLLLSVVRRGAPAICNAKIKTLLEKKKIIISVGSACNTASPKASHVLYAMNADEYVRRGALRITMGDTTTLADIQTFLREFIEILRRQ